MLLLLNCEHLDFLLELRLSSLALSELLLHVAESLRTTHSINLLLERQDLFLLTLDLFVDTGKFMLFLLNLIGRV